MIRLEQLLLLAGICVIISCRTARKVYVPVGIPTTLSAGPVDVHVLMSQQSHKAGASLINVALAIRNTDSLPAVFIKTSLTLAGTATTYTNNILYYHPNESVTSLRLNVIQLLPGAKKNIPVDFISENRYTKKQLRKALFADSLLVGIKGQQEKVVLRPRQTQ